MPPTARTLANAIRMLSADAVQQANSGHPGMPMGMADIAQVLWMEFLRHNPNNPRWHDRDRFVLSNGHGSMLLYSLLHLSGYELPMEQLRRFRQLGSMTPGHPEFGHTPGVETTTGPLGQGLANAVGMALAERTLGAHFNRPGHSIVDHHTYVFVGDGCLMEGISHEAGSLAGTLGLGKLIAFYDDNGISIDGEVRDWFTDNTPKRFEAYGWHVLADVDGHDSDAVRAAIETARAVSDRPSLICCKTIIGWGSPNRQGKESCHGAPLGHDELAVVRERLDWPYPPFVVPEAIYAAWDARARGAQMAHEWQQRFVSYRTEYPELAAEFVRRMEGELSTAWDAGADAFIDSVDARAESIATRKASQQALNGLGPMLPELIGGSADLRDSNLTAWSGSSVINREQWEGNYILYGVREFAMTAISNGLALHGGILPYAATFLMFSEYARNALRMAALMGTRGIFVFTHDSIGLGEDGPTHQAVEQAATLRLIPRMSVWRPCDAVETAVAWRAAVERRAGPTCLLLTRQTVPHMARNVEQIESIRRGGYVLMDCHGTPEALLIATGSEVSLAMDAALQLTRNGRRMRVVSMPSTDVFDAQKPEYQCAVLAPQIPLRIAIEAGVTDFWRKYVGLQGVVIGIDDFGVSAPASDAFAHFDLSVERIVASIESKLETQTPREPAVAD